MVLSVQICAVCDGSNTLLDSPCPLCGGDDRFEDLAADAFRSDVASRLAPTADAPPLAVDWFRRCRRCRPGRRGASLLAGPSCPDCLGVGRARLSLSEEAPISEGKSVNPPGVPSTVGFARRLSLGEFRNIVVCTGVQYGVEATYADCLLARLERNGWLRRVYTEGDVGFHARSRLPSGRVVSMEGSSTGYGAENVFPCDFSQALGEDFPRDSSYDRCDLMLVLGSDLQEAPFCAVPNLARRDVPRLLVGPTAHRCFRNGFSERERRSAFPVSYGASVSVGRRRVTLRPRWGAHYAGRGSSKYREQWVFNEDVSVWSQRIILGAGWETETCLPA